VERRPRSVLSTQYSSLLGVTALNAQLAALYSLVPPYLEARGYSVSAVGLLVAIAFALALLARLPAGLVYRRSRARGLLAVAVVVDAAATVLHVVAADLPLLVLARVVVGAAHSVATTVNFAAFVEDLGPGRAREQGVSYYTTGIAVGYAIGSFASGFVVDAYGYPAAFGLTALFSLAALFGLPPAPAPSTTIARGTAAAPAALAAPPHVSPDAAPAAPPSAPRASPRAALQPEILLVVAATLLLNVLFAFWNAYLPLYGLAVGLSLAQIGVIRGLYGVCNVVGRPLVGRVVGTLGPARLILASFALQTLLLAGVPLLTTFTPLLLLFIAAGCLRAITVVSTTVAMVTASERGGVPRGITAGLYNAGVDSGVLLGPALGGLIAGAIGLGGAFVATPALAFGAYLLALGAARAAARPAGAGPARPSH
jgi:predicted MFS family arabinose efflux permease